MGFYEEQQKLIAFQKKKEREDLLVHRFLREAMTSDGGKLFLQRMMTYTSVYHSTFNTDAMKMAFEEGKRDVGLFLTNELKNACPTRLFKFHINPDIKEDLDD